MSEAKRREVLQLLKEYRTFHTPFGGAMPVDETGVRDASYGPAGYIESGMEYTKRQREDLRVSYNLLEKALYLLKTGDTHDFIAWMVLHRAYLSDPADSSVVAEWRKKNPITAEWHDKGIDKLAELLRFQDLYVVWPKRMTSREEKQVERMNDEFYRVYRTLRDEGVKNREAIKRAATMCGYSEPRGYEIVRIRGGRAS